MPARRFLARRSMRVESLETRHLLALDTVSGSGVTAQYFSDAELQTIVASRLETGLTQDWGNSAPLVGLNPDQFSARFISQVEAAFTELHTFSLSAEGGVRLWVNGILRIDRWNDTMVSNATATLDLISGRRYDIQVEFRETSGAANIDLKWSSPSRPQQAIATTSLFPSERGSLQRRTWNGVPGSTVTALTSIPSYPNLPSAVSTLAKLEVASTGSDQYGDLLIGNLHPSKTGIYRFYIAADDTAELWLSNIADPLGKQRIAFVTSATAPRDWTATASQQSALVSLVAGQAYAIEVIHKENSGTDHVAVGWKVPGSNTIDVIAGEVLSAPMPTVRVFSQRANAIEGDAVPLEFVVQRSGGPVNNPLVVSYALRGTALSGSDYTAVPGMITIPVGALTASVFLSPSTDILKEGTESVLFEVVDGPGYGVGLISERRSLGTIQDVFAAPVGGAPILPTTVLGSYQAFGGASDAFAQVTPIAPYSNIIQRGFPQPESR